jgi:hypothetical protein
MQTYGKDASGLAANGGNPWRNCDEQQSYIAPHNGYLARIAANLTCCLERLT